MSSEPGDRTSLAAQRARLERARYLALTEPSDALAAYYALYHDPGRSQFWLHPETGDQVAGFVAVCQTGHNLFQPTVVVRADDVETVVALLCKALHPGRPYYIVTTPNLAPGIQAAVHVEREEINWVYRFDPRRHRPEINVLVQSTRSVDGSPKFVIRSRDQIASESGTNWRSPHFAELFVRTEPWARRRGWGKAVVSACAMMLAEVGVQPLYMVTEENVASMRLAISAGFVDTGVREFAGAGVFQG